jgi:argininosuccinate lyase
VRYCVEKNCALEDLNLEEMLTFSNLIDEDIFTAISLDTCVRQRKITGAPAPETVSAAIEAAAARFNR